MNNTICKKIYKALHIISISLHFSFPSQIQYLPLATNALTNILTAAAGTATTTTVTNVTESFEGEKANN